MNFNASQNNTGQAMGGPSWMGPGQGVRRGISSVAWHPDNVRYCLLAFVGAFSNDSCAAAYTSCNRLGRRHESSGNGLGLAQYATAGEGVTFLLALLTGMLRSWTGAIRPRKGHSRDGMVH